MVDKIAICMACYNGAKYISQQLDSILNQTVQNFTLYISDDGSSDETIEILKNYERRDNRIVLLSNHAPTGSAKMNFLYLLSQVDSDIYFFSDQDDVWTQNHIEIMLASYLRLDENKKASPVLVYSNLKVVDENLNEICGSGFDYMGLPSDPKNKFYYFTENNVTGGVSMINDALKKVVFWNEVKLYSKIDKVMMHDYLFASVASLLGTRLFIDETLELYRQHANNVVGAGSRQSSVAKIKKLFNFMAIKKSIEGRKKTILYFQQYALFFVDYFGEFIPTEDQEILQTYGHLSKFSYFKFQRYRFLRKNGLLRLGFYNKLVTYLII